MWPLLEVSSTFIIELQNAIWKLCTLYMHGVLYLMGSLHICSDHYLIVVMSTISSENHRKNCDLWTLYPPLGQQTICAPQCLEGSTIMYIIQTPQCLQIVNFGWGLFGVHPISPQCFHFVFQKHEKNATAFSRPWSIFPFRKIHLLICSKADGQIIDQFLQSLF